MTGLAHSRTGDVRHVNFVPSSESVLVGGHLVHVRTYHLPYGRFVRR